MNRSQKLRNLRGGTIYAAAGVNPTTARAWVNNNDLLIGYRETKESHPRYDLGDAARLLLMRFLTTRLLMSASAAVHIVNSVQVEITMIADTEIVRSTGPNAVGEFEHCIVAFMRADGVEKPEVRTPEQHALMVRDGAFVLETVVDLRALIRLALDSLKNADAVEGWGKFLDEQDRIEARG